MSPQNFANKPLSAVIAYIIEAINTYITPIIISMAMLVFLYGIFTFVRASDDPEARKEGRNYMIYGVIGLFVMISVWGFVRLLANSFDIPFGIPQFNSGTVAPPAAGSQNDYVNPLPPGQLAS